jgi:hypothetical protein
MIIQINLSLDTHEIRMRRVVNCANAHLSTLGDNYEFYRRVNHEKNASFYGGRRKKEKDYFNRSLIS